MIVLGECILGQVEGVRHTSAGFLFHALFGVLIAFIIHVRSGCRVLNGAMRLLSLAADMGACEGNGTTMMALPR